MSYSPVKFIPIFKERIWGSDRLKTLFNKDLPAGKRIGESWELAELPANCSIIADGPWAGVTLRQMLNKHGRDMGFTQRQCDCPFGLLIKFLDADDVLSVQVHPDEKACQMFPGAQMKTECWYVLQARPEAVIYRGLKPGISREHLEKALKKANLEQMMQIYPAQKGDLHFLPAGTLHALGAGVVIAEIQTPSDTTFRLYDWNRIDEHGRGRELHVEQALASIHYTDTPPAEESHDEVNVVDDSSSGLLSIGALLGRINLLIDCPYFCVGHLSTAPAEKRQFELAFPVVMIVLAGGGMIGNTRQPQFACRFDPGDTLLLPTMERGFIATEQSGECLLVCLGPKKVP